MTTATEHRTPVTRVVYETTPCTRCGGNGRYSFNLRDGSRCYGCKGTGKAMTKRAKALHKRIDAAKDDHFTVAAEDVQVGDRLWFNGGHFTPRGYLRVVAIEPDNANGGRTLIFPDTEHGAYRVGARDGHRFKRAYTRDEFWQVIAPIVKRSKGGELVTDD